MSEYATSDPTEKTLYTEPHDDHFGTWQDRLYECGTPPRKGIGISVGGMVYVKPLKEWHKLEAVIEERGREFQKVTQELLADNKKLRDALGRCIGWMHPVLDGLGIKQTAESRVLVLNFAIEALAGEEKK